MGKAEVKRREAADDLSGDARRVRFPTGFMRRRVIAAQSPPCGTRRARAHIDQEHDA
jgi:hypothetical protein